MALELPFLNILFYRVSSFSLIDLLLIQLKLTHSNHDYIHPSSPAIPFTVVTLLISISPRPEAFSVVLSLFYTIQFVSPSLLQAHAQNQSRLYPLSYPSHS